jgi:hypothetical protein
LSIVNTQGNDVAEQKEKEKYDEREPNSKQILEVAAKIGRTTFSANESG